MKVASALTLVATLVALIAPARAAEQRDGLHAGASLDRDAELMQRCLEPQMAPWQIESTSSTDGKTTDSVRLTRWGDMPESRCLARLGRSAEACALPHGLQRVVRLEFVAGEPHPAWSANDRARLEDLIPSTLQQPAGDIRIKPAPSSGPDPSGEILRVRLAYLGMPTLQRTLAEWVRGPRGLVVTMTLVDPAGGDRVMASRELTFRQGPQWSDPQASTSSARWSPACPRPSPDPEPIMDPARIHPTAIVDEGAVLGPGTRVWHFAHVLPGTRIGARCVLAQNCMVGPDVVVGDGCKIQNNVSIYRGVTLEDDVFCGPSMVFTNVLTPRAFVERKDEFLPTLVRKGATIGANATVVCGVTVGRYAMVGAGAVVSRDVPSGATVRGVPAR